LYEVLAQQPDVDKRVLNISSERNVSFVIPMLTGHPSLFGHGQDNPTTTTVTLTHILESGKQDTSAGQLTPDTTALFNQINIGYLVTNTSTPEIVGLQKVASTEHSILWRLSGSRPLTLFTDAALVQSLETQATVLAHHETNNTVYLEFEMPSDSFAQLSYAYYPYLEVWLDDAVTTITSTPLGLIGLPLNKGHHVIEIKPVLSPLRQGTLVISLVTSGLLLGWIALAIRRYGWLTL
jgi:hypothetical protein